MAERASNSFNGGMSKDLDKQLQGKDSYRDSLNGRVIYNEDGTMAWQNAKGTVSAVNTIPDKTIIGHTSFPNFVVLFMLQTGDSTTSEIGVLEFDTEGFGEYATLFESADFAFDEKHRIEARPLVETSEVYRVYWTDHNNEVRTFSFLRNPASTDLTLSAEITLNTVTNKYYAQTTAHSSSLTPEHNIGKITFDSIVSGGLLSGMYQYTYRLSTSDGYKTPWTIPTNHIMMPSDEIPEIGDYDMWQYSFESVNVTTNKGIKVKIDGIDQRYEKIEVAYIFTVDAAAPLDSAIFLNKDITGTSMDISHATNSGIPLLIETIANRNVGVKTAKTIQIHKNHLFLGNITTESSLEIPDAVFNNISIEASIRGMLSDNTKSNNSTLPLTRQSPINASIKKRNYINKNNTDENQTLPIVGDYQNYKGTQVSKEFTGYFRGEKYRFGVVFFDKVGNPMFTTHLADVTFPDMNEDNPTLSWIRLKSDGSTQIGFKTYNRYDFVTTTSSDATNQVPVDSMLTSDDTVLPGFSFLRIMGIMVNGIDTSVPIPEAGNKPLNEISSGFSIVRVKREGVDETVKFQGAIHPLVTNTPKNGIWANPNGMWLFKGNPAKAANILEADGRYYTKFPNYYSVDSPDVLLTEGADLPVSQSNDRYKFVGTANLGYNIGFGNSGLTPEGKRGGFKSRAVNTAGHNQNSIYLKCHTTKNSKYYDNGFSGLVYNMESEIDFMQYATHDQQTLENLNGEGIDYQQKVNLRSGESYIFIGFGIDDDDKIATHPNWDKKKNNYYRGRTGPTVLTRANRWKGFGLDIPDLPNEMAGSNVTAQQHENIIAPIINYVRENKSQYNGLTPEGLSSNIFVTIGHFQPINSNIISNIDSGVFSGIEVFGGDCYLDYFDYSKIHPRYWLDGQTIGRDFIKLFKRDLSPDYSIGYTIPIESKYNHMMRAGADDRVFGRAGARSQKRFNDENNNIGDEGVWSTDAITFAHVPEQFNIQGVLLASDKTYPSLGKPVNFCPISSFPTRWRHSEKKIYGECDEDSFRTFLPNNFFDVNGQYGEIVGNEVLFDSMYSFQESAFSRLRVLERALVDTGLGALTIGAGPIIDEPDYKSFVTGCQHQFSITKSDKAIYWADANKTDLCRFAQDGLTILSDVGGLHSFINPFLKNASLGDKTLLGTPTGVHSVFDFGNNDVLFTIQGGVGNEDLTLAYNEDLNSFTSRYSFHPKLYINFRDFFYSQVDSGNKLSFLHMHDAGPLGVFYGVKKDSTLEYIVNDNPSFVKKFDNVQLNINEDGINILNSASFTAEQQTHIISIANELVNTNGYSPGNRAKYRRGLLRFPVREKGRTDKSRVTGKFMVAELTFVNDGTTLARVTSSTVIYRLNFRL